MDLHFQNKQKPRFFFSFAFSPLNSLFYHLEIFSLIASYNRVKFDPTMSTLEKKILNPNDLGWIFLEKRDISNSPNN